MSNELKQKLILEFFLEYKNAGYIFNTSIKHTEGKKLEITIDAIDPEKND